MQPHPYGALPRRQRRYGRGRPDLTAFALTVVAALLVLAAGIGASF